MTENAKILYPNHYDPTMNQQNAEQNFTAGGEQAKVVIGRAAEYGSGYGSTHAVRPLPEVRKTS